jgi:hypothetical protein
MPKLHLKIEIDSDTRQTFLEWGQGWVTLDPWDQGDLVDWIITHLENKSRDLLELALSREDESYQNLNLPPRRMGKHGTAPAKTKKGRGT